MPTKKIYLSYTIDSKVNDSEHQVSSNAFTAKSESKKANGITNTGIERSRNDECSGEIALELAKVSNMEANNAQTKQTDKIKRRRSFLQHFYIRKQKTEHFEDDEISDTPSEDTSRPGGELEHIELIEFSNLAGNIFAGTSSSVLSTFASQPFDQLRRLYQMEQMPKDRSGKLDSFVYNTYRSVFYRAKVLYKEKGISGFYKYHCASQILSLFRTTALFWTFETLQPMFDKLDHAEDKEPLSNFAAGFLSGAAAGIAGHLGHEMVLHLSAGNKIKDRFKMSRVGYKLFEVGGWKSFSRGLSSTLLHISPLYGCKFMFYNIFCDYLMEQVKYDQRNEIPTSSLLSAGAVAGGISNSLVYPLDVIRQRMQSSSLTRQRYKFDDTCRRIGQCFLLVWRREGVQGFYRGIVPCLMRTTVSTSIQFAVYDKVHKWMRSNSDVPSNQS